MIARVLAGHRRVTATAMTGSVLVALAGGCSGTQDGEPRPGGPAAQQSGGVTVRPDGDGNPLSGATLYTDPGSQAAQQAARWRTVGRAADATELDKIGARPVAHWLTTRDPAGIRTETEALVRRAADAGQVPVLVAYNIPHRDCGNYSAGGAADAEQYRTWIRAVAAGLGSRPAVVVLEPDAVAHTLDGCRTDPAERHELLNDAVAVLKGTGATRVYLDAGNPGWLPDTEALAGALRRSGVQQADGFALNVANFIDTQTNVEYGNRLSTALDGAHFVIDTSRNGRGQWTGGTTVDGGPSWCNPPDRGLGTSPTTETGLPRVDALLWVKRPGESDGACRPGEPAAGTWWLDYALGLARRAV
ncbi:glycoside hydrolase family 6 protein [Micromonospora polyrhachis]|uniref:Glucanase n=1 Tax=Micromonospora polyrhachis TaxID=1282883 RepID=A0A7W7WR73_9ACTN|nr:glycoside hydrolase family 6 protein [Micromonospora polyrhachis]MBB4960033.1 endoglucanase [Micromonospora polyrhachis]